MAFREGLHGGGAFVWPLIRTTSTLAHPIQIEIPLKGALSMRTSASTCRACSRWQWARTPPRCRTPRPPPRPQDHDIIKHRRTSSSQLRGIASMKIEDITATATSSWTACRPRWSPIAEIGLVLINVTSRTSPPVGLHRGDRAARRHRKRSSRPRSTRYQVRRGAIGVAEAERGADQRANAVKLRRSARRTRRARWRSASRSWTRRRRSASNGSFQQMPRSRRRSGRCASPSRGQRPAVTGENLSKARIADTNAALRVKRPRPSSSARPGTAGRRAVARPSISPRRAPPLRWRPRSRPRSGRA